MILNGDPNSPTLDRNYGTLVSWDDNADADNWAVTRAQFIPGDGLVVLEAQERLLRFLIDCCALVLHEVDMASVQDAPVLPEPVLKQEAEAAGFDSLAVMASEAPYRVPAKIDFNRIIALLAAWTSAAEDHIWSLREDPAYFASTLMEIKEHRLEMLPDMNGNVHPTLERFRQHILWERVIGVMIGSAYLMHESFAQLLAQPRLVQQLQQSCQGALQQFQVVVPASPPMRNLFWREPPPNKTTSHIAVQSRPAARRNIATELTFQFSMLWEDGQQIFLLRMTTAVDELERLIETEPEAKSLVSAHVAAFIGDLSIVAQCLAQIDLYQPWSSGFENHMVKYKDTVERAVDAEHAPMIKIQAAVQDNSLADATKLGTPTGGRFAYPCEKRPTKENTEALRQAERNLDAFWACVDRHMYVKAGDLTGTATQTLLLQPRIVQRTAQWVEPVMPGNGKGGKKGAAPANKTSSGSIGNPLSAFYFGVVEKPSQGRLTASSSRDKAKIKTKTKGMAAAAAASPTDDLAGLSLTDAEPVVQDTQPTMPVDARALKVFRTLFFNADVSSTPGEVPWRDFLHAMTSTGFQAEKLYGSVWQFRLTALDIERSIQFHEPHPRGKMTYEVARRVGRRLNRAYGWVSDMFVLKK
ncbi:uncharacterized protein SPSK_01075 [Sporothrix schenckii 1099-18]|uniref:Uncharacterized protein n=1 Tax=Sporothrix schenckii 1099-18 TaxID=1397361 RepID=A0A0F2LY92_SPOSC|nr:uncharacterized protein SPSK_01075 [Sporothrix schenckii 1099-18]KJR81440.1 hypothetical protein SPSK_01075 [Sporothrix schenckii 1099-18]